MTPLRHRRTRAPSTPIFGKSVQAGFWPALVKVLAVPVIALVLLLVFGQPALRIQYTYRGSMERPVYERCLYLTALSGWRNVTVRAGSDGHAECAFVRTFPFTLSLELFK